MLILGLFFLKKLTASYHIIIVRDLSFKFAIYYYFILIKDKGSLMRLNFSRRLARQITAKVTNLYLNNNNLGSRIGAELVQVFATTPDSINCRVKNTNNKSDILNQQN